MRPLTVFLCALCAVPPAPAQQGNSASIDPVRAHAPRLVRPYEAAEVPPVRLSNSSRLAALVRAGNLYLTAQDAIALALENNIDVEVSRYNALLSEWSLERAQAGGALPGVPSVATQAASVANGQGVLGSQAAAGININNTNNGAGANGNATVSQVGPVTQTLDPTLQESTTFSHRTLPTANTIQFNGLPVPGQPVTLALVQDQRIYNASYQQGLLTGGSANLSFNNHFLNENAPTDVLNPSSAPALSFTFQQSLLQGRGVAVNSRNITVAKMNLGMSDTNFRAQVTQIVVNVLNLYYSFADDDDDVHAKQKTLETAQIFLDESRKRLDLGAIAQLDVTTAENQVAIARLALLNSQTTQRQDELQLKNLISRNGLADPVIANVHIIPTDRIVIPATDDIPTIRELAEKAIADRPDLIVERENLRASEISALGTQNGVLPLLQVQAIRSDAGLSGVPRVALGQTANPYFVGGIGTAVAQIARQNFPTESGAVYGRAPIHNDQAQADFGIDQLKLRQQRLSTTKDINQAQVDLTNAVVALRQARAGYDAAVQNRILQEQLLVAEQKKFNLGASTSYNVVQQQRDLSTAQSAELSALLKYQTARISLDQATGSTLEANHVSLAGAKTGTVPGSVPKPN